MALIPPGAIGPVIITGLVPDVTAGIVNAPRASVMAVLPFTLIVKPASGSSASLL